MKTRHTRIIPTPDRMQERWRAARAAFTEALGASEPLPLHPAYGHYVPGADDFLSAQLKNAPDEATAAFTNTADGDLAVELVWWTP